MRQREGWNVEDMDERTKKRVKGKDNGKRLD